MSNLYVEGGHCFFKLFKGGHLQKSLGNPVLINNTKVPTLKGFKDLRINISESLKWSEHINYLYNVAQVSSYQILKVLKWKNLRMMFFTLEKAT